MTNESIRSIILRIVEAGGPVKFTTLALSAMDYIGPAKFDAGQFHEIVSEMVLNKEIVEIRYKRNGDTKSMYAARLTEVIAS